MCVCVPARRYQMFPAGGRGTTALAATIPGKAQEKEVMLLWQASFVIHGARLFPVRDFGLP